MLYSLPASLPLESRWRWEIASFYQAINLRLCARERQQYWKSVPALSMVVLALAVFFIFSTIASVSDLAEPRPSPYWWVPVYAANTIVTL